MSEQTTDEVVKEVTFKDELTTLLNQFNKESKSNTPDYILAEYLMNCLNAYDFAMEERRQFYSK